MTDLVDPIDKTNTGDQGDGGANEEAKKYRLRLREVETERDGIASQLDSMRRQVIDRAVTDLPSSLSDPADLWRDGLDIADLLTEDGSVDLESVSTAVATVIEQHPGWSTPGPSGLPGGGSSGSVGEDSATWADVLAGDGGMGA